MKDNSSCKLSNSSSMEVKRSKFKEEPYISSARIRSLVRHLSSSMPRSNVPVIVGDHTLPENSLNCPNEDSMSRQTRKQVRRRLNTGRPYQERLMNMAEARREIVTALKFHRAAMKKASEQQQKEKLCQPTSPPSQKPTPILEESHFGLLMDTLKPNHIALNYTQQSSYMSPFSYSSPSWTYPQFTPPPFSDNLIKFTLPHQPLGLNLNFQSFNNVETPLFCYINNNNKSPVIQQPTSSSTSTSSSSSSTAGMANLNLPDQTLHPVMGDKEMEEIRSISEKHDIEWNDMMNSVKTAWWSKFLKAMEADDDSTVNREGDPFQMFSEVMKIPALLSNGTGTDNYLLENQMDDKLQDITLPR
ncbi:hypothetical protein IEQ34_019471 [Dendrobium chrysotoxum]|uniref:Uncharacterized protein n=1 Tax=Dendrobium chrysotoxum TaxID=161865 RepID=A0AAV7G7H4_DENCH|nr:hypothetical protein IEQ34_019471 [Dendrobium chrysotoxum]